MLISDGRVVICTKTVSVMAWCSVVYGNRNYSGTFLFLLQGRLRNVHDEDNDDDYNNKRNIFKNLKILQ